ncbi:MAG: ATP synthase F1 subunit delta [Rickettsiales bacterium]|nr:ATP synthase F1 subunit delta [Rickettsiales bacterium]
MEKYFTNAVRLYSTAFFEIASEKGKISSLAKEFTKLKSCFVGDSSIIKNIAAPVYSKQEQQKLLSVVADKLGFSSEMINFIYVLLANKRLKLFPLIADHFEVLMHESLGTKIVEVTLNEEVSLAEQKTINKQLEDVFSSKLDLSFKTDEKILAGIIVKTDNKMFDASLRTKFTNLTDSVTKKMALL